VGRVTSHSYSRIDTLSGEFAQQIPAINKFITSSGEHPFRFIFLDPKGWSQIPMNNLQLLLKNRSCEVLINLMTKHIVRFLDEPDRAQSYQSLFGRAGVLEILQNIPSAQREERAVQEYSQSLRILCGFKYVSSAVILEPNAEAIRYHLIYATNHPRGIEVFKAAETKAARIQDDIRFETHVRKSGRELLGLLFDEPPKSRLVLRLRQHYAEIARKKVVSLLSRSTSPLGVVYKDLFCEAMTFPLVTPDDLVSWLQKLVPAVKFKFENPRSRKPSALKDDRILVEDPKAIMALVRSSS
jgi:hypothetical protein